MSIQSMVWAMRQDVVKDASARHVLLCLSNYAGDDGRAAFPAVSTLSIDTGLSERTIRAKLDHLESIGVIRKGNQAIVAAYIDRSDRRPVCYDLVLNGVQSTQRGANDDVTGCNLRQNGVQSTSGRGAAVAPDNKHLDPSYKPSLKNTPPDGVSSETWAAFSELRKKKRAPITDLVIDGIRRESEKAGWPLENALRECCIRGWSGFKAEWVARSGQGQTQQQSRPSLDDGQKRDYGRGGKL